MVPDRSISLADRISAFATSGMASSAPGHPRCPVRLGRRTSWRALCPRFSEWHPLPGSSIRLRFDEKPVGFSSRLPMQRKRNRTGLVRGRPTSSQSAAGALAGLVPCNARSVPSGLRIVQGMLESSTGACAWIYSTRRQRFQWPRSCFGVSSGRSDCGSNPSGEKGVHKVSLNTTE